MSSSVPYIPDDDFENNNPFAEPILHSDPHNSLANDNLSRAPDAPVDQVQAHAPESDKNATEISDTNKELRRLLPERFTTKSSLQIKLTAIEKNRPGNPILRFDAVVKGLPKFRQSTYKDIRRTYNEVVKFNKYLIISNLEAFVPVIPNASTSYPSGGEDENKQLMNVWREWFARIVTNPILIRDDEFVYFIENDFGYSVINNNRKSSVASGLIRKTLKQFSVPYDEFEELATFRPLIKSAYLILQKLSKLEEKNSKTQKQLSIQIYDLSNQLNSLSQFETIHPGMKNMWEKLAKISQIQSDLLLIESVNELGILGDGIQNLIEDFYQVKEALTNRHLIMRELLQAEAQTKSKHLHATKIKSKSALDPLKVDEAIRSLEYSKKVEESLKLQVNRISGEMLIEKQEVLDFTEHKFQKLLKSLTLHRVDHHRKILKHLENIRLDIRIVDAKGGLSRLNRDNLTNLKHNLMQSQSSNGDAWSSRTFRSLKTEQEERERSREEEEEDAKKHDEGEDGRNVVDAKNAASLLGVATF
ncbi:putative vacuolar protein sorting-associated protein [Suhomyces tanzawaensis NRRL Y-17324]|uniref:Vacuolar protein sorting-associated protein 17 n=1 Tax=Suhomyces tanzawaensis NRRL Y-17324 TaxID=984487 RepID=A0A1E4SDN8_9ASCO|nr:putative vacuolar protein sorting-associated protein [Suhomyces tanzawaensis NRRL Y-17324]ODV77588.1 putative vacuolar protein sorting-associated protein [Suhomyces tanzawaensis NRRL Y-17324]